MVILKTGRRKSELSDLIYKYWGKAQANAGDGMPDYHLLVYHCLDVAAVGKVLLEKNQLLR